jgi:predicted PurR-regulated permease PerM
MPVEIREGSPPATGPAHVALGRPVRDTVGNPPSHRRCPAMAADDRSPVSFGRVFRWAAVGTLGVLLVLFGAYGVYRVRDIVVLVVIALFLSVSVDPVVLVLTMYTLGATVCVVVALFSVGLWPTTVVLVLFFLLYQPVENYVLVPRIFRNTVDMPSAAVLLVALIGGALLGLAGAVMAIPIAATVKVAMSPTVTKPDEPPPRSSGGLHD